MTTPTSEDGFRDLAQLVNSAALDPRKWRWFLEELHTQSRGVQVQMFSHDARSNSSLGMLEYGYDPAFIDSFVDHYAALNPWTPAFLHAPPGVVVHSEQAIPLADLERTEFYADWVRPQDDIVGGAGALLERGGDRLALIGGNIRRRDRDRLEAPFAALLGRLLPFVQHALQVSRMLGDLTIENRVMREGMEPDLTAVFALDRTGRVHFTNRRAEKLLQAGEVVRLDIRSRLHFASDGARAALACALNDHFQPEMTVSLPFFAGTRKHEAFICRTSPVSEIDGPLPWLATNGSQATGFVLLFLAAVAPNTRLASRLPTIG